LSAASIAAMMRDQLTLAQKAASNDMPGFFETHGSGFGASAARSSSAPTAALALG